MSRALSASPIGAHPSATSIADGERCTAAAASRLAELLRGRRTVALTGAGMSTESGIPDYRGEGSCRRPRTPVQHRDFLRDPEVRARYWARSMLGWERFGSARPNGAHSALAALEQAGLVTGVITQNVDGLHQAAGSREVLELHGALARVRCLACERRELRSSLQERLVAMNSELAKREAAAAPDGDAELDDVGAFIVPECLACGGVLKPDVVFFGDNVPRDLVAQAFGWVEAADALIVLGSSLTVFSGFRFARRAAERQIPLAIVNLGPTRADAFACLRNAFRLGEILPALVTALEGPAESH